MNCIAASAIAPIAAPPPTIPPPPLGASSRSCLRHLCRLTTARQLTSHPSARSLASPANSTRRRRPFGRRIQVRPGAVPGRRAARLPAAAAATVPAGARAAGVRWPAAGGGMAARLSDVAGKGSQGARPSLSLSCAGSELFCMAVSLTIGLVCAPDAGRAACKWGSGEGASAPAPLRRPATARAARTLAREVGSGRGKAAKRRASEPVPVSRVERRRPIGSAEGADAEAGARVNRSAIVGCRARTRRAASGGRALAVGRSSNGPVPPFAPSSPRDEEQQGQAGRWLSLSCAARPSLPCPAWVGGAAGKGLGLSCCWRRLGHRRGLTERGCVSGKPTWRPTDTAIRTRPSTDRSS